MAEVRDERFSFAAIANAVCHATGVRFRKVPIRVEDIRVAFRLRRNLPHRRLPALEHRHHFASEKPHRRFGFGERNAAETE